MRYIDHDPPSSESSDDEDSDDEDNNNNDGGNGDDLQDSNEWVPSDDEEASEAMSDKYYRYEVNDKVDAYWCGDETTIAGWEHAMIIAIDADIDDTDDKYSVIFDFSGDQVRSLGG